MKFFVYEKDLRFIKFHYCSVVGEMFKESIIIVKNVKNVRNKIRVEYFYQILVLALLNQYAHLNFTFLIEILLKRSVFIIKRFYVSYRCLMWRAYCKVFLENVLLDIPAASYKCLWSNFEKTLRKLETSFNVTSFIDFKIAMPLKRGKRKGTSRKSNT